MYSLIADPALFDACFAHSAALWRDDDALVKRLDAFLGKPPALRSDLFFSLGSEENDKMTRAFQRAVAVLEARAPATLRWHAQVTRLADHGDNAYLATPVGLRRVFADWPTVSVPSRTQTP